MAREPSTGDVLECILSLACDLTDRGYMLNERYLHHAFSHRLQAKHDLLEMGEGQRPALHPEWPTHKKSTGICGGSYRKTDDGYMPVTGDKPGHTAFIDFAVGDYAHPDVAVEFSLSRGWEAERVTFDLLKLLDGRNKIAAGILYVAILRPKPILRMEARMEKARESALARLLKHGVPLNDARELHFVVSRLGPDAQDREHWHRDAASGHIRKGLPDPGGLA